MKTYNMLIKKVDKDVNLIFLGTDEERDEIERIEDGKKNELKRVVLNKDFKALKRQCGNSVLYLSYSTRKEQAGRLQLSFIDVNGVPVAHEVYGPDDKGISGIDSLCYKLAVSYDDDVRISYVM